MYHKSMFGGLTCYSIPVVMEDTGAPTVPNYNNRRPIILPACIAGKKDRPGKIATNPATLSTADYGLAQAVLTQSYKLTWTPVAASNLNKVSSSITSPVTDSISSTRQYGFKFDSIQTVVMDGRFSYSDLLLDFLTTAESNSWGASSNWDSSVSSFKLDIGAVGKAMYSAGYRSGMAYVFFTFCGINYGSGNNSPMTADGHMRLLRTRINSGPGGATVDCSPLGDLLSGDRDSGFGFWMADSNSDTYGHFCFHACIDSFNIYDAYNLSSQRSWTSEYVPCCTCNGKPSSASPKFPAIMVSVIAADYLQ